MLLEDEQYELLTRFVEAHLSTPQESRGAFTASLSHDQPQATFLHSRVPNLSLQGSMSDAEILADAGLLRMSHSSRGHTNFSVLPLGIKVYEQRRSHSSSLGTASAESVPDTLKLFVSHSTRDLPVVALLVGFLRSALNLSASEIRCTSVDGYRLPGGVNTDEQLRIEVHNASAFVGVISSASLDSMYVTFELGARWGAGKHLLPLLAPGTRASVLGGPLAGINALRLDNAAQLHQLVSDLAKVLAITPEPAAVYQSQIDALMSLSQNTTMSTSQVEEPVADSSQDPVESRVSNREYDVFISFSAPDRQEAVGISEQLKQQDLNPLILAGETEFGQSWLEILQKEVQRVPAAAILFGSGGLGAWQNEEVKVLLQEYVSRQCILIPVILATCDQTPKLPAFLRQFTHIDFRVESSNPITQLVQVIKSVRNSRMA